MPLKLRAWDACAQWVGLAYLFIADRLEGIALLPGRRLPSMAASAGCQAPGAEDGWEGVGMELPLELLHAMRVDCLVRTPSCKLVGKHPPSGHSWREGRDLCTHHLFKSQALVDWSGCCSWGVHPRTWQ